MTRFFVTPSSLTADNGKNCFFITLHGKKIAEILPQNLPTTCSKKDLQLANILAASGELLEALERAAAIISEIKPATSTKEGGQIADSLLYFNNLINEVKGF